MTGAWKLPVGPEAVKDPVAVAEAYARWVERGGLAAKSKQAYASEVAGFARWLAGQDEHDPTDVFVDKHARDYAVRDYRRHLLTERKRAPKGVDLAMTSVQSLFVWLGIGRAENIRTAAPRHQQTGGRKGLEEKHVRAVLRAAERRGPRDLALLGLGLGGGLRVSELHALDLDDVHLSERKGVVQIRAGKGDQPRTVPVNKQTRDLVQRWLEHRPTWRGADSPALWLSREGQRLAVRSIQHTVEQVGAAAGVDLHPHLMRHTYGTTLVRGGIDVVTVAGLMGHASIETTRGYAAASPQDEQTAVELLIIDF